MLFLLSAILLNLLTIQVNSQCQWLHLQHRIVLPSLPLNFVDTVKECKRRCWQNRNWNCKYGFIWLLKSSEGSSCFFASTIENELDYGYDHYLCTCHWKKAHYSNVSSLSIQSTINTLDECKYYCYLDMVRACPFGLSFDENAPAGYKCGFFNFEKPLTFYKIDRYYCEHEYSVLEARHSAGIQVDLKNTNVYVFMLLTFLLQT